MPTLGEQGRDLHVLRSEDLARGVDALSMSAKEIRLDNEIIKVFNDQLVCSTAEPYRGSASWALSQFAYVKIGNWAL